VKSRVPWVDGNGIIQVNHGHRVQFKNAIGPSKDGLHFRSNVNFSVLTFLGFERVWKNWLAPLPMGGGKGSSDFASSGKPNSEGRRFCRLVDKSLRQLNVMVET
jgi:glutamate dehydrogenase (NADP+)